MQKQKGVSDQPVCGGAKQVLAWARQLLVGGVAVLVVVGHVGLQGRRPFPAACWDGGFADPFPAAMGGRSQADARVIDLVRLGVTAPTLATAATWQSSW